MREIDIIFEFFKYCKNTSVQGFSYARSLILAKDHCNFGKRLKDLWEIMKKVIREKFPDLELEENLRRRFFIEYLVKEYGKNIYNTISVTCNATYQVM